MGQKEVIEAIARLNDRLKRPVTRHEIAEEAGYHQVSVDHSLTILKRWGDIKADHHRAGKHGSHPFRYYVPEHVREKVEPIK